MHFSLITTRLTIALAALVCGLVGHFVSRALHVPVQPGFDVSLLRQPNPIMAVLVVGVVFVAATVLVTFAIGRWRREAGLFCGAFTLAGFSLPGGSITSTLQYANGSSTLLVLLAELVLLYTLAAVAVYGSQWVTGPSEEPADKLDEVEGTDAQGMNHNLLSIAVQAVVMAIVMLILGQNESKKQALAVVAAGSYLGAIVSHYTFPVRNGYWLAIAPLIVGCIGYLLEWFQPTLLEIGLPSQPLAIALPIDYVLAGITGGILGHWMSRKWKLESQDSSANVKTTETSL